MNFNFLFVQSTGIIRKSFPSVPRSLLMLVFFAGLGSLTKVQADGMFVAPKFVWDKHKDINEPTQKAIIVYDAGHEDLVLQVKYEGPVDEFGWLIPVPNLPTVQKGSMKCFYELSRYTQQRFGAACPVQTRSAGGDLASLSAGKKQKPPVKVIEIKTVGAYEVAVLSAKDSGALENGWTPTNFISRRTRRMCWMPMSNNNGISSPPESTCQNLAVFNCSPHRGRRRIHCQLRHSAETGDAAN